MIFGSLPRRCTAERIAARSTSSGTPVKSCSTMRATTKGISSVRGALGCHDGQGADRRLRHPLAIAIAQQRLQHEAERHGQARGRAGNPRLPARAANRTYVPRPAVSNRRRVLNGLGRIAHGGNNLETRRPCPRCPGRSAAPVLRQPVHFFSAAWTAAKFGRSFGVGVCSEYLITPSLPTTNAARADVSPMPARLGKTHAVGLGHGLVEIGKQRDLDAVLLGPGLLRKRAVHADAVDFGVEPRVLAEAGGDRRTSPACRRP